MTTDGNVPADPGDRSASSAILVLGILFILAGLAFLAGSFIEGATVARLWPLFLLIPVVILGHRYLTHPRGSEGVLVPVGVLSYLAVFFLWQNFTGWEHTGQTWPHFLLAPALGLFLLFLATRRLPLLIPVSILTVLALLFFGTLHRSNLLVAATLLVVGVVLLASSALRRR
jgi:hypothetical protein